MTKKITKTVYLEPEQSRRLKNLSARTRVPAAIFMREAVDLVLTLHETEEDRQQPRLKLVGKE